MAKISKKTINQLSEKDLRNKIQEARSELTKLRIDVSKGTLRKKSGEMRPVRHNIARMLTRLNQMKEDDNNK